jgi:phospholipid-transporting ATPase
MSNVICYTFYKNVLMSLAQFWFNFNCLFSGQKYYTEYAIQAYNLLFSSIPILLLGIYDMDIHPKYVFAYPKLYLSCLNHEFFNVSACF